MPRCCRTNGSGQMVFQPHPERAGDVARMIFYFSIRWGRSIDRTEASILRQWHLSDPVSARERERNDRTEAAQGNRNPL